MDNYLKPMNETKGFAILIKAPGAVKSFKPGEGTTIEILDANGRVSWSFKAPMGPGPGNPGLIIHEVQIDLLTERDFGKFCENTWRRLSPDEKL